MNTFLPRSMQTEIELKLIASVLEQIITPQSNKPIIGCIMDTVVGSALLTADDKYLKEFQVKHILSAVKGFDGDLPEPAKVDEDGNKLWLGRDIMTYNIPEINYVKKLSDTNIVEIVNGKITKGTFNKAIVGSSSGGLVHNISNDLNLHETANFLNNIQKTINAFLKHEGFTVGFGDSILPMDIQHNIKNTIFKAKADVNAFIQHVVQRGVKITIDEFESKIFNLLNKARDDTGGIAMKSLDNTNNLFAMVNSGSKGNFINVSQITACVGQQNVQVDGKPSRIPFTYGDRTLPHFQKYDMSPEARGFIEHSYLEGLTPYEFFFHAQSGREGLIDTAVKTAETG
jgi:DNA-directed RNA polymerase II subunit RPB1